MQPAKLLFPALRWTGSAWEGPPSLGSDRAPNGLDWGGFIVFGGTADGVRQLTEELQQRAERSLLFAADLERGAGQQFEGCTPLPPAAALAALNDPDVLRRAGELTAREARAVGISWIFAPVADLSVEQDNPIVGTRSFGPESEGVARAVTAWIEGCEAGGGVACVKHFPGHGRTTADSHLVLPTVEEDRAALAEDLRPFEAAVDAGVPSVMTAHVAYPALDPSGRPATRSPLLIDGLLRKTMGFEGVVVTDALVMAGATGEGVDRSDPDVVSDRVSEGDDEEVGREIRAAVDALGAGVDALLYPRHPEALVRGLEVAVERGELGREVVRGALGRLGRIEPSPSPRPKVWGAEDDVRWAEEVARRTVELLRGRRGGTTTGRVHVVTVDDDAGGPGLVPDRGVFRRSLRRQGVEVADASSSAPDDVLAVVLHADVRGWKGRVGLSEESRRRLAELLAEERPSLVVLFGPPHLSSEVSDHVPVLRGWRSDPLMQRAAAGRLAELLREGLEFGPP